MGPAHTHAQLCRPISFDCFSIEDFKFQKVFWINMVQTGLLIRLLHRFLLLAYFNLLSNIKSINKLFYVVFSQAGFAGIEVGGAAYYGLKPIVEFNAGSTFVLLCHYFFPPLENM